MRILLKGYLQLFLIVVKIFNYLLPIDDKTERDDDYADDYSWYKMTPDIYTLIVQHKHAFEYFFRIIEIDSITMSDMFVIFHVSRCSMIITDGMRIKLSLSCLGLVDIFLIISFYFLLRVHVNLKFE